MFFTWQIKAAVALVVVAALTGGHAYLVNKAVARAEATQLAEFNRQVLENVMRSIDTEQKIKNEAKALMDKKNADLADITRDRNRLIRMLSDRSSRPNTVTTDTGSSCTGTQLYREDGEFLAGEAARAEKLIKERNYYYDQYEQARKKIDEQNNSR